MIARSGAYHWSYDANGNLLSQVSDAGLTTTYHYNNNVAPNELVSITTPYTTSAPITSTFYQYDNHGDTTSITTTGPLTLTDAISTGITYDAQERPITITHLGSGGVLSTISLAYNADGQRSRYTVVTTGTVVLDERFQYREGEIGQVTAMTATLNGDGSIKSSGQYTDTYLYDENGLPLELLRQQNGTTSRYWYILDGQGSVVALTDATGKVVDRYNYDSWGEPIGKDYQTVPQQLRYASYWYDGELTWYWVSVRYYDPEVARWVQPDIGSDIRSYVYEHDDPVASLSIAYAPPSLGLRPRISPKSPLGTGYAYTADVYIPPSQRRNSPTVYVADYSYQTVSGVGLTQ